MRDLVPVINQALPGNIQFLQLDECIYALWILEATGCRSSLPEQLMEEAHKRISEPSHTFELIRNCENIIRLIRRTHVTKRARLGELLQEIVITSRDKGLLKNLSHESEARKRRCILEIAELGEDFLVDLAGLRSWMAAEKAKMMDQVGRPDKIVTQKSTKVYNLDQKVEEAIASATNLEIEGPEDLEKVLDFVNSIDKGPFTSGRSPYGGTVAGPANSSSKSNEHLLLCVIIR